MERLFATAWEIHENVVNLELNEMSLFTHRLICSFP